MRGLADVLQAVRAEVAERGAVEQSRRLLGDEHLAAVADRRDPRAAVNVHADVALLRQLWLAGMQPHADANRRRGERRLAGRRRRRRVRRACERVEERVALRVDLDAAVRGERLAQQAAVLGEQVGVRVAVLGEELGRALHVGEEQRDRAGGELAHRAEACSAAAGRCNYAG